LALGAEVVDGRRDCRTVLLLLLLPPLRSSSPPANAHPIVEDAIRFIVTIVIGVIPVNERVQERDVPPRTHVRA
jgi:hypothetical protein